MNCLRCGGTNWIQNADHPHWRHCPECEPDWADHAKTIYGWRWLEQYAHWAARDPRGRPNINKQP